MPLVGLLPSSTAIVLQCARRPAGVRLHCSVRTRLLHTEQRYEPCPRYTGAQRLVTSEVTAQHLQHQHAVHGPSLRFPYHVAEHGATSPSISRAFLSRIKHLLLASSCRHVTMRCLSRHRAMLECPSLLHNPIPRWNLPGLCTTAPTDRLRALLAQWHDKKAIFFG